MTFTKPGPSTATVMMASKMAGIDRKMSTRRMITVWVQPRRYPAAIPRVVPTTPDSTTDSDTRAP